MLQEQSARTEFEVIRAIVLDDSLCVLHEQSERARLEGLEVGGGLERGVALGGWVVVRKRGDRLVAAAAELSHRPAVPR